MRGSGGAEGAAAALVTALLLGGVWALGAGPDARLSPDGVEYLSIARNLAEGRGATLPIKWHFFHDHPPPLPAAGERPLLLPLLLAPGILLGIPLGWLQLALLGVAALLVFSLARRYSGRGTAWFALLLVLAYPGSWNLALNLWPDLLYLDLLLGAALAWGPTRRSRPLCGGLLGLAALARPEGVLAAAGFLLIGALEGKGGRECREAALLLLAGFSLPVALSLWWVYRAWGTPWHSLHAQHLRVLSLVEGMWFGYGRDFPTAFEFLARNGQAVGRRVGELFAMGFRQLVFHAGPLAPGLFALLERQGRKWPAAYSALGLAAVLQFAVAHSLWASTTPGDPRYLNLPTLLLVPPLLHALARAAPRPALRGAALGLVACLAAALWIPRAGWMCPYWGADSGSRIPLGPPPEAAVWLAEHLDPGLRLAAMHPWDAHLLTGRETVILPLGLQEQAFLEYLRAYRVGAVWVNREAVSGRRFRPRDYPVLQPVAPGLWQVVTRGSHRRQGVHWNEVHGSGMSQGCACAGSSRPTAPEV